MRCFADDKCQLAELDAALQADWQLSTGAQASSNMCNSLPECMHTDDARNWVQGKHTCNAILCKPVHPIGSNVQLQGKQWIPLRRGSQWQDCCV